MKRLALALAALLSAGASAHDTWFERLADQPPDHTVLALGTGTRFAAFQFPIGIEQLTTSGCLGGRGATVALAHVADRPDSLWLRTATPDPVNSCWAQVAPVDAEIGPPTVEIYLDEIRAPAQVRADWAAQQRRGVPWRERYTKHARIELRTPGARAVVAQRSPMGMDIVLKDPQQQIRSGDVVNLLVLRDQLPLAGLALELHSSDGLPGRWQTTDAEGRARFVVPGPGRWLVRGTELRRADRNPDLWLGGFVTLAFDAVQDVREGRSKARSSSQSDASATTSSEPPSITKTR